mmetsp:Transcript_119376/g.254708  ORF Transcript_119376/g.254708 Transcript_119376/m.254708 type:complete len:281 (-) Transcript_119376:771-1613(-)
MLPLRLPAPSGASSGSSLWRRELRLQLPALCMVPVAIFSSSNSNSCSSSSCSSSFSFSFSFSNLLRPSSLSFSRFSLRNVVAASPCRNNSSSCGPLLCRLCLLSVLLCASFRNISTSSFHRNAASCASICFCLSSAFLRSASRSVRILSLLSVLRCASWRNRSNSMLPSSFSMRPTSSSPKSTSSSLPPFSSCPALCLVSVSHCKLASSSLGTNASSPSLRGSLFAMTSTTLSCLTARFFPKLSLRSVLLCASFRSMATSSFHRVCSCAFICPRSSSAFR